MVIKLLLMDWTESRPVPCPGEELWKREGEEELKDGKEKNKEGLEKLGEGNGRGRGKHKRTKMKGKVGRRRIGK